ncbi:MarR family transcriptional regulator [Thermomicrobium sp. CFH 73360]|uniref:MarR family transcriptional regulator n=1 Tax=Thermomicrobium sp. CFH 73360 TaxID=2951987 RepID=UPI0020766F8A|nr:MarR family transcriptional regulator [Thermomicrobium sp. CFH 73360]MCM8745034.1 MarR family transcriptional regulator [Thermomicrobium sp. CFH 73360]
MTADRLSQQNTPTQVTELLLQVILTARVLGILVDVTRRVTVKRDMVALQLLTTLGPLRASELAVMLGISRGAATRLVDGLERAGLAHRESDPRDRRAVLITPTPAGRLAALADIAPAAVLTKALLRLDTNHVVALQSSLDALLTELLRGLPQCRP